MRLTRILPVAGGIAGIATLLLGFAAPASADSTDVTGSAIAISADVSVLNTLKVDVPATPRVTYPDGGQRSLVDLHLGKDPSLLALHILHVGSNVEGDHLHSFADLADVSVLGVIRARVLNAECTATADGVNGSSQIVDVQIGHPGTPDVRDIQVTANQPINLNALAGNLLDPLVGKAITVTFDEQIRDGNSLTVNALHVHADTRLLGGLTARLGLAGPLASLLKSDIIVSQAMCTEGTVPPGGGGGGTSSTSPTPTSGSGSPTPTSGSGSPTTTTEAGSPTTTSAAPVVGNASSSGNLPFTGVAGVVPMVIGALVLLAAGATLFLVTRRRRATSGPRD